MLHWSSLFKTLYRISKNPAFPVPRGQIMRSAEAKLDANGFFYPPPGSGLRVLHSDETDLQYCLLSPVSAHPDSTSFIWESVKCYTFQASYLDLFQLEATVSFSELTNMTFGTFVTGSQRRIHIEAFWQTKKNKQKPTSLPCPTSDQSNQNL